MTMRCVICSHNKRLKIDRAIVKGKGYSKIAIKYNVPMPSVRNHAVKHLSRQMLKSNDMKEIIHSKSLFENVQELINRTKVILDNAEDDDRPTISLGAIRELRKTYEFLIKFQIYMETAKKQDKEGEMREAKWEIDKIKERLSVTELSLLTKIMSKMNGELSQDTDILKEAGISTYDRYKSYDDDNDDAEDDDAEDGDGEDTKVIDVPVKVKKKKKKKKSKLMKRKKKKKLKVEDEEGDKVKHVSRRRRLNPKEMFKNADDDSIQVL